MDERRRKVLDLFTKGHPRSELEMSQTLRHPLTGLWLTEGAEFKEWCRVPGSRIWLSGIPGAGKSVIAGAIIDECMRIRQSSPRTALAYFFCTYRDTQTHESSNILSSLASQLARQDEKAYQILEQYYGELRSHKDLPGEPRTGRLLKILKEICALYDQVFLIVDGLDECGTHTDDTLKSLLLLLGKESQEFISMALLSRDEIPIRQQLEDNFGHIEIAAHTEDVQLYVAAEIDQRISSKKLRIRDISLKDEIMAQLVDGAKGMYVKVQLLAWMQHLLNTS